MTAFQMRQCPACHLRYPVPAGSKEGALCPSCDQAAPFVTAPFAGRPPAGPVAGDAPRIEGLLDNLRSLFNVGSIFRTADGAGVGPLHLCGITATPQNPKLAKTSLGAENSVAWQHYPNALEAAHRLQNQGHRLWALESTPQAVSLFKPAPSTAGVPIVLVVGNERAGIDPQLLTLCDRVLYIPMQGTKESLNVAIAFSIAAYFLRYRQESRLEDPG